MFFLNDNNLFGSLCSWMFSAMAGVGVRVTFAMSCGYFLHDLVEMMRHWHAFGRRSEMAHHLVSLTGTIHPIMLDHENNSKKFIDYLIILPCFSPK